MVAKEAMEEVLLLTVVDIAKEATIPERDINQKRKYPCHTYQMDNIFMNELISFNFLDWFFCRVMYYKRFSLILRI